jgi:16S rRNA (guanine966-N2)-methyltransferase
MLRITSGLKKNKRLKTPQIEGFRGVQEIVKNAIFSILGEKVENANCLDLFAGSGNLGLEALSRGAAQCDFVDENYYSIGAIMENVKDCDFDHRSEITKGSAVKFAANTEKTYDIIFLDPFYDDTSHVFLMTNLEEILNPQGKIVFFHGEKLEIEKVIKNTKLKVETQRKFGRGMFTVLQR